MPVIKSALIIGAAIFLCAAALWRWRQAFYPRATVLDNPAIFFSAVFLGALVLRWPMIVFPAERNFDESQMLAQAMRFLSHPVPWRDVDSTTSGPLNSLLLAVPISCGAPASWETARLTLFVVNCGVVLLMYLALRRFASAGGAMFAVMPLVFFFAFTTSPDFTHYSSETLPSLLISGCFYLLARHWTAGGLSKAGIFLEGVLLGAVPFAKLQAAPLALYLGAIAFILIITKSGKIETIQRRWVADTGTLCAGALVAPVLILGVVSASGAFEDFWKSYILASVKYASLEHFLPSGRLRTAPPLIKRVVYVGYILFYPSHFGTFSYSAIGSLAVLTALRRCGKALDDKIVWPMGAVLGCGALTILCFFTAGKPFPHYGMLLAPALALFIGLVFVAFKTGVESGRRAEPKPGLNWTGWTRMFLVLVIGPPALLAPLRIYDCIASGGESSAPWTPSIAARVKAVTHAGDTLSVWGWMPEYYVRTGLPPATRDAVGHYVVSPGPMQEYYRERYLRDLKQSRPAVFLDVVDDGAFLWNQWTAKERHESFPELSQFIDENYGLLAKIQLWPRVVVGPARIYVLKERLAELRITSIPSDAPATAEYPPDVWQHLPK